MDLTSSHNKTRFVNILQKFSISRCAQVKQLHNEHVDKFRFTSHRGTKKISTDRTMISFASRLQTFQKQQPGEELQRTSSQFVALLQALTSQTCLFCTFRKRSENNEHTAFYGSHDSAPQMALFLAVRHPPPSRNTHTHTNPL